MLDNPFYTALTSAHAHFSQANGRAVRYKAGIIPFGAVPEHTPEAMRDFRDLLSADETIFTTAAPGETFPDIPGLTYNGPLPGLQMHYAGNTPPAPNDPAVLPLTSADVPDMLALKEIAFPGYFGPRAHLLGDFFGIRDPRTNELIAMAGERLATFTHSEISAVCTHPEHLGCGYATRLMYAVMRAQAARGVASMLHVIAANTRAIELYQHLGFTITGEVIFHRFTRRG